MELDYLDDIEELYFEYSVEEIGIKSKDLIAKIKDIRQLRPIIDNQPWGIFIIEFEPKKIPITVLRKILSTLIPSRRKENLVHEVWNKEDLLFFCFFGNDNDRSIGIAQFSENKDRLPTLKVHHWNPNAEDENFLLNYEKILNSLEWPKDNEVNDWKEQWNKFFTREYGQVIRDSKLLTKELAKLSMKTKKSISEFFEIENEKGYLHKLYRKFKDELIHDLCIEQFADMYAQTIAYGLFSARCMTENNENFQIQNVVEKISNTNPFLKELLKNCFKYSIGNSNKIRFDELDLGDIVELLNNIDTKEILLDFGRQSGGGMEDPILYFYEGFLNEYENETKKRRGVYYTPKPIVGFIVKSVDDILKDEFGYADGLANTSNKKIKYTRKSIKRNRNGFYYDIEDEKEVSTVQILDPATGTGTFLHEIISKIKENFDGKHKEKTPDEIKKLWNEYVPKYLLPRINGFELMMAPYAVTHMNLGLVLKETGYEFKENERINVFLTNTLEQAGNTEITFFEDPLSNESCISSQIKKNKGINIIIGNPPYLASSINNSDFISNLLRGKTPNGEVTENYFEVENKSLNERNPRWLNDDYVKFIRLAQYIIERSDGGGVIAYITNHGYLNNPTFRGMRESLLNSFDEIYILDLHGNSKRKEKTPDGNKDENVFDIQQGVCISIFIKLPQKKSNESANLYFGEVWGTREHKYEWLKNNNIVNNKNMQKIIPKPPFYLFVPENESIKEEYEQGWKVTDIFIVNSVGIVTARDGFTIQHKKEDVKKIINEFSFMDVEEAREKYNLRSDVRDWKIKLAQEDIIDSGIDDNLIVPITYRPFDIRYTYYTGRSRGFHCMPRSETMKNMIEINNLALLTARSNKSQNPDHFFCSNNIVEFKCSESTTGSSIFPMYTLEKEISSVKEKCEYVKKANISIKFINEIADKIGIKYTNESILETKNEFNLQDIFYYIYSIIHSCNYRNRYSEFLKIDFPRIMICGNRELFAKLVSYGKKWLLYILLRMK